MFPDLDQLLSILDAAYDHKSWHGTNLRGSIRGLSVLQAAWRPSPKRHNIWELVVHAAYWKYTALRRLTGAPRGSFPLKGSNWFVRGAALDERGDTSDAQGNVLDERAWRDAVALLDRTHRSLRAAVAKLPVSQLAKTPAGSEVSNFALLSGLAAHDLYHAGQIQLLKRLFRDRVRT
ncbi:MAG: DinB family protein [Acidobacteria bacterium]|nr:DinB family protein [Acidobacteriota bacterium]